MPKFIDSTGQHFERWTIIRLLSRNPVRWECQCDCGRVAIKTNIADIRNGKSRSCGCLTSEKTAKRNHVHGDSQRIDGKEAFEYRVWSGIRTRCFNTKHGSYKNYGGRGVSMCDRWRDSYINFLQDMGRAPPGTSIDRINNNGDYEPGNCQWRNRSAQITNRRDFPRRPRREIYMGQRFNRLTAIALSGHNKHGQLLVQCKCDCGNVKIILKSALLTGRSKSCGCLAADMASKRMAARHAARRTKPENLGDQKSSPQ